MDVPAANTPTRVHQREACEGEERVGGGEGAKGKREEERARGVGGLGGLGGER